MQDLSISVPSSVQSGVANTYSWVEDTVSEVADVDILTELSNFIFTSKYARYNEDLGRRETWEEAVSRVEQMHLRKFSHLSQPYKDRIHWAFDMVRQKLVVPSMRSMQFGGAAVEAHNARIFNCLSQDTEFITTTGKKSFRDFNDGDVITVLSHTGKWQKAVVRSYGIDYLDKITFTRGRQTFVEYATSDHRWILKNGKETTSLKEGDRLCSSENIFRQFNYETAEPMEKLYWAYGYVYGDGSCVKNSEGVFAYSMVRLCGEEKQYKSRFEELGFKTSQPLSCAGDFFAYTGTYLKTTPNPEIDSPELIRAFVAGYLDADGSKINKRRNQSGNKFNKIQSSNTEHIEFIRKCFPMAGVFIVKENDLTGQVTNYGTRPHTVEFYIYDCPNNQTNSNSCFKVSSIEKGFKKEDVWCLAVEEDRSFVLSNGLVTGNCAVRHVDSVEAFSEIFYLLLCGCGVGIGLFEEHLNKMPSLINLHHSDKKDLTFTVPDSIEGWADSLKVLVSSYVKGNKYSGKNIVFNYSKVRLKGSPLKTGGGKAPGPDGLRHAHQQISYLMNRCISFGQFKLRTIDAYDVLMHAADAVLSGGVRRAATSVMFAKNDSLMMEAKTGKWFETDPQRARSNNSVLLLRNEVDKEEFKEIVQHTKEWGEPGFVFADHRNTLFNPCFEISFMPITSTGKCGVQFCNLTSINGTKVKTQQDFINAIEAATIIGTLQASYTNFPYLSKEAEELTKDESLLGVSITAMMDNPQVLLDPVCQKDGAKFSVEVNKVWAKILDVKQAARVTCIKPEGTSTLVLGSMASGIHPSHAHTMFRRVQMNKLDTVYQYFKEHNPHLCEESIWSATKTDDVVTFPVEVPITAKVKGDLSAIQHLDIIKSTQENWVLAGSSDSNSKPLTHNVSCTVVCKDDEWDGVIRYLYDNKHFFSAVSLLAHTGDKSYKQVPMEAVVSIEDKYTFKFLKDNYKQVDYTQLYEGVDETAIMDTVACAGGACEIDWTKK